MTWTFWLAGRLRKSGDILVLSACALNVSVTINIRSTSFFISPHSGAHRRGNQFQVTLNVHVPFQSEGNLPLFISDLQAIAGSGMGTLSHGPGPGTSCRRSAGRAFR